MRRWARPVHFARLRVNHLTSALVHAPQAKWSRHLQLAGAILQEELKVPGPIARQILAQSVVHALASARGMDQRVLLRSRSESRTKLRKSFSRVEKCIARAPAYLRSALDNRIHASTPKVIDTEAIEAIIDAACQTFAHSEVEAAKTAVRTLSDLKTEYERLDLPTRRNCETALSLLPPDAVSGRAIFKTLTTAMDESPAPAAEISAEAGDLIINYVEAVATIWRENGLRPSRGNPSKFQRFVELVLTAVTEPGSNRHTADRDEIARRIRANHRRLPAEMRSTIGKGLRREDCEWLVSDDHVRKVLAHESRWFHRP